VYFFATIFDDIKLTYHSGLEAKARTAYGAALAYFCAEI
jgi:hypothetical protein